ncbi:MAG: hypothetical protein ABIK62_05895 [candidate division WOR-3 bacterium]
MAEVPQPVLPGEGMSSESERAQRRRLALYDVAYLSLAFSLYITSLFTPLFGIAAGIIFMTGGVTSEARKIGRVCMILGIINLALVVIWMLAMLALGTFAAGRWHGFMPQLPWES